MSVFTRLSSMSSIHIPLPGRIKKKAAHTRLVPAAFTISILVSALALLAELVGPHHFLGGKRPWN